MATCSDDGKISLHDNEILKHIFAPDLRCADDIEEKETRNETVEENEQVKKAKELEIQGVRAAEAGDVEAAITIFGQAITIASEWSSTYNNRAQAFRLKGDVASAKADLEKALELSHGTGMIACQAFTQRGLIRKREGDDDGARQDFERAAGLGSWFAKQLLIAMNPYAALCNQMLCDIIRSGQSGPEI